MVRAPGPLSYTHGGPFHDCFPPRAAAGRIGRLPYHRSAMPVITAGIPARRRRVTILAAVPLALGLLALLAPVGGSESPASRAGALRGIAATVEAVHSARRSTAAARRRGTASAL